MARDKIQSSLQQCEGTFYYEHFKFYFLVHKESMGSME
jgi:hypothetical protein